MIIYCYIIISGPPVTQVEVMLVLLNSMVPTSIAPVTEVLRSSSQRRVSAVTVVLVAVVCLLRFM